MAPSRLPTYQVPPVTGSTQVMLSPSIAGAAGAAAAAGGAVAAVSWPSRPNMASRSALPVMPSAGVHVARAEQGAGAVVGVLVGGLARIAPGLACE